MFDLSAWSVFGLYVVFAVIGGWVAWRIWGQELGYDADFWGWVVTFGFCALVGWLVVFTTVPAGGIALGRDGAVFVNPSQTWGRVVLGKVKTFKPETVTVEGAYMIWGENSHWLVYTVKVDVGSEALLEVARFEQESQYTLIESVEGLLWQLQDEKSCQFKGFNNPTDLKEQDRFSRMVGEWLQPRLPKGVVVSGASFLIRGPVYQEQVY